MTKRVYTTAQGKQVDIDGLRIANEQIIAVGNMKVNARGDELGPGGKVATTRNQAMESYYKLNSMVPKDAVADEIVNRQRAAGASSARNTQPVEPELVEEPIEQPTEELVPQEEVKSTRGSLASSVAKQTTVTQELLTPLNKRNGISRI